MKPAHFIIGACLVASMVLLTGIFVGYLIGHSNYSVPYSEGRVIDLPEEITQADPTDILGATITKDTIHIYFKK